MGGREHPGRRCGGSPSAAAWPPQATLLLSSSVEAVSAVCTEGADRRGPLGGGAVRVLNVSTQQVQRFIVSCAAANVLFAVGQCGRERGALEVTGDTEASEEEGGGGVSGMIT